MRVEKWAERRFETRLEADTLANKIFGLGFDSFEGMPAPRDGDDGLIWRQGDLPGELESLQKYLDARYRDFQLVKGYFADTLPQIRDFLSQSPPIFVSIDCDYYSSTMDVLSFLLPELTPNGCLFYFDDISINFYSDKTGEMKAVTEVNAGKFGSHIQLVEYPLWLETREMRHYKQIYRYFNLDLAEKTQQEIRLVRELKRAPRTARVSPLYFKVGRICTKQARKNRPKNYRAIKRSGEIIFAPQAHHIHLPLSSLRRPNSGERAMNFGPPGGLIANRSGKLALRSMP
jgi:hypothetical protein